jgi:hypothetical protein
MNYERVIKTDELQQILNKYKIQNFEDISNISMKLSDIDIKEGELLLLKHFDFHCKDRVLDYIDGKNSKEEEFLKRNVFKCFQLATPRFYTSYQQLRKTIRDKNNYEEKFIKECIIFENTNDEISLCLTNKLKNFKKLIDYDVYIYLNDLEEFRNKLYL